MQFPVPHVASALHRSPKRETTRPLTGDRAVSYMVGATGFEPATSCSRSRRSTGLSYAPPKARAAFITAARARPEGLEPTTPRSVVWCSIQLSYGRLN
jgi:hypothetical protein